MTVVKTLYSICSTIIGSLLYGIYIRIFPIDTSPDRALIKNFLKQVLSKEIAHRGGSLDAPENTMYAFKKAVERGAKTIEIDIQYSRDGVPFVIHDETLDRTTNGKGAVRSRSADYIKTLNANVSFTEIAEDVGVPTLEEVVKFACDNDVILLFDVKGGGYCSLVIKTITDLLRKYPHFIRQFAVISFFPDILLQVRRFHPRVITGFTRRHDDFRDKLTAPFPYSFRFLLDRIFDLLMFYVIVPALRINMLEVRWTDVCESYLTDVAPLPVLTWTVNDPVRKSYFKKLGCGVMTDTLL